jgi:hypothetical protein
MSRKPSLKVLRNAFTTLYQRNSVLAITGLAHLVVGLLLLCYMPFETRQVMGINLWIKPIKFYLSVTIYLWTLAIFLPYLRDTLPKSVRAISWLASLTMIAENIFITMQAARGTTSHFNTTSSFDGIIFAIMGGFILLNTGVIVYATWLFWRNSLPVLPAYRWGIRLGMVLFIFGSVVGGVMSGLNSHNVGVPMGGEGLPFTNWSTRGGDLRIAHFIGLHALQIVPLVGWLIARNDRSQTSFRALVYTVGFALLYAALTGILYWQAMNGVPLIASYH